MHDKANKIKKKENSGPEGAHVNTVFVHSIH